MNSGRSLNPCSHHGSQGQVGQTRTTEQSSTAFCGYSRQEHSGRTCLNVTARTRLSLHGCTAGAKRVSRTRSLLSYSGWETHLAKFNGQFITWTAPVFVLIRAPQVQKGGPRKAY